MYTYIYVCECIHIHILHIDTLCVIICNIYMFIYKIINCDI